MRETATNKVGRALKAKPDPSREAARADLEIISFTKCYQIKPDPSLEAARADLEAISCTKCNQIKPNRHTCEKLPPTRSAEP